MLFSYCSRKLCSKDLLARCQRSFKGTYTFGIPDTYESLSSIILNPKSFVHVPCRSLGTISNSVRQRVVLGVSGGVDSAVAGLLLKNAGYDLIGVFMRNWDESEELGNQNCSIEKDLRDARSVCSQLDIPFHEANFVSEYWNNVFADFVRDYGQGLTPNPDLGCNRHIKFGAFLQYAQSLGAEKIATGHYARIDQAASGEVQLLMGLDRNKDQSYFLASVHPQALSKAIFPLGSLRKSEVRQIAVQAGLTPAQKRSSAGICFIGRRRFSDFLAEYLPPVPATFVNVDTGNDIGKCTNMLAMTNGQGAGISGLSEKFYVVGKDMINRIVYVGQGRHHPALLTRTALLASPHWISEKHRKHLLIEGVLKCQYKARYRQEPKECHLYLSSNRFAPKFQPTKYSRLEVETDNFEKEPIIVHFPCAAEAITPQQHFVMYDKDLCLGTSPILIPGMSLHELQ